MKRTQMAVTASRKKATQHKETLKFRLPCVSTDSRQTADGVFILTVPVVTFHNSTAIYLSGVPNVTQWVQYPPNPAAGSFPMVGIVLFPALAPSCILFLRKCSGCTPEDHACHECVKECITKAVESWIDANKLQYFWTSEHYLVLCDPSIVI